MREGERPYYYFTEHDPGKESLTGPCVVFKY